MNNNRKLVDSFFSIGLKSKLRPIAEHQKKTYSITSIFVLTGNTDHVELHLKKLGRNPPLNHIRLSPHKSLLMKFSSPTQPKASEVYDLMLVEAPESHFEAGYTIVPEVESDEVEGLDWLNAFLEGKDHPTTEKGKE